MTKDGKALQPALAGLLASPRLERAARLATLALFVATLAKCAWLTDDYFITLRSLDFLFAGEGLRYNHFERSNLHTSLLALVFQAIARMFTKDPFLIFASFAIIFNGLCLWLLWQLAGRRPWRWCLAVLLLLASKAYIDFSWSGLENPIGYTLAIGFVLAWLRLYPRLQRPAGPPDQTALRWLLAIAALAPLYRHDLTLLVWPATAWAWWDMNGRQGLARMALAAALVATPLAIYTLASLVYFGLPLPASAYFKLSSTTGIHYNLSIGYSAFRFVYRHDPATLALCLAVAPALLLAGRRGWPLAIGCVLTLLYIALNGGMYMGGRFFSTLYSMAVAVAIGGWDIWAQRLSSSLGQMPRRVCAAVAAALLGWALLLPGSPLASSYDYEAQLRDSDESYVLNIRQRYHWSTRMGEWLSSIQHRTAYPAEAAARIGLLMREQGDGTDHTVYMCEAGIAPYSAGINHTFIGRYGLTDSFLARMPVLNQHPAHKIRWIPDGYFETMAAGTNMIKDPLLARYYDTVRLVTGGEDLFARERLAAIIRFNLGLYDHLRTGSLSGDLKLPKYPEPEFKNDLAVVISLIRKDHQGRPPDTVGKYLWTRFCQLRYTAAADSHLARARP